MSDTVRKMTCIICPKGCELTVTLGEGGEVKSVTGHTCKRGEAYAIAECTHPVRTLTSTVRAESGGVYPVKTDKAIPKELLFEAMGVINGLCVSDDLEIGDAVIEDLLGTGARVVITGKLSK